MKKRMAWRLAQEGWFQLHDERGRFLGMFEARRDALKWIAGRRRLRVYRLDYWFYACGEVARVQRRWRVCGNVNGVRYVDVPLAKGG